MNPELILEAMESVDDALIAEVERLRRCGTVKPRRIWLRYAGAAACACLVLGGVLTASRFVGFGQSTEGTDGGSIVIADGAQTGTAENYAGGTGQIFPSDVKYIRTDGYHEDASYPLVTLITSERELDAYFSANRKLYALDAEFRDACASYDAAFFETCDLLLVLLEEGSGSVRHRVLGMDPANDGGYTLRVERIVPEIGTCDMAEWHLFVGIAKETVSSGDSVTVMFQNIQS